LELEETGSRQAPDFIELCANQCSDIKVMNVMASDSSFADGSFERLKVGAVLVEQRVAPRPVIFLLFIFIEVTIKLDLS
jgi:hypothetical protein